MMEAYSSSIPVSLLRQYVFCPRIPYYVLNRGLKPHYALWVTQGISYHEKIAMLAKRRNFKNLHINGPLSLKSAVSLEGNQNLPMHGVCDGALEYGSGSISPLEFKIREFIPNNLGSVIQLAAYAMLLELRYCKSIEFGFILYGTKGKYHKVCFTKKLRDKVLKVLLSIREDSESCLLPSSSCSGGKCAQCEFLNFCADRL